jgi:hypothetical protein
VTELVDYVNPAMLPSDEIIFKFNSDENFESQKKFQESLFDIMHTLFGNFTAQENPQNYAQETNITIQNIIDYTALTFPETSCKIMLFATTVGFAAEPGKFYYTSGRPDAEQERHLMVTDKSLKYLEDSESLLLKKLYANNSTLDVFVFGDSIPLERLSPIVDKSGGTLYWFELPMDPAKMSNKLYYSLYRYFFFLGAKL